MSWKKMRLGECKNENGVNMYDQKSYDQKSYDQEDMMGNKQKKRQKTHTSDTDAAIEVFQMHNRTNLCVDSRTPYIEHAPQSHRRAIANPIPHRKVTG
jgi:hypothetical protein